PPDGHAGGDHDQRQEHDAGEENPLDALPQLLHVYRLVGRLFRADRDQVFVGTQPIHHVQEQVAIAVEAQEVVADPARAAHHYEPALAGVGSGGGQRQWNLFVLLGIDADLFALQVIRRVAVVAGREQLLYRGIAARFYVHRAGQWKRRGYLFQVADDGMRFVGGDQRNDLAQSENLADAAGIERQVVMQGHAPGFEQLCQRRVRSSLVAPELNRRIHQEQGMAAVFDILLDRIHSRLLVIVLRTADDEHRAVARDFRSSSRRRSLARFRARGGRLSARAQQRDRLRLIVVLLQRFLDV